MKFRSLSAEESAFIRAVADKFVGPTRDTIISDVLLAKVCPATSDGSRLTFDLCGYRRDSDAGQTPLEIEGRMLDSDGAQLSVVLFVDKNERLLELEFIRWETGNLISPDWRSLRVGADYLLP